MAAWTLFAVLLLHGGPTAPNVTPTEAARAVARYSDNLYAFDLRMKVTTRRLFETVVHGRKGDPKASFEFVYFPPGQAVVTTETIQDVYCNLRAKEAPQRRVERFEPADGTLQSHLAFDGTQRQSFYPRQKGGLIGGPPDNADPFRTEIVSILPVLGIEYCGQSFGSLFGKPGCVLRRDGALLVLEAPLTPDRLPQAGYRAWLDPSRGMALARFEAYQFLPKEYRGRKLPGGGKEYISYRCVVDEFKSVDQGLWVPVRATVSLFDGRGRHAGNLNWEHKFEIDMAQSRWNPNLGKDAFQFDFPVGTQVHDEKTGVDTVISE
jgi:hypothetical protein